MSPPPPPSFPNQVGRAAGDPSDRMGGALPEGGTLTPESSRDNLRFPVGVWGHILSCGKEQRQEASGRCLGGWREETAPACALSARQAPQRRGPRSRWPG